MHVDNLLACGPAADAEGHEAAACTQRLDDQASVERWPTQLVVFVGDHTARLARNAGLLDSTGFRLGGTRRQSVIVRGFWEVGEGAEWTVLGKSLRPTLRTPPPANELLRRLVNGRSAGHAWRPIHGGWQRSNAPIPSELVDAHLAGDGWLSPFRPTGDWPYCVLDVDLHNAIQYTNYDSTLKALRTLFPNSLFFQSSVGGGTHVYVRLPPETTYADGAAWLAEFLFVRGHLMHRTSPGRFATTHGTIASRAVEVPLHPPRLPFGVGSELQGYPVPAKAVARFEEWLNAANFADFDRARAVVSAQPRRSGVRWPERAAWARRFLSDLEFEALGRAKPKPLPKTDPWTPYLPRLAPTVAALATHGCVAFGTRTGTMKRLVEALTEIATPDVAQKLLRYWVVERDHNSEDIHSAQEEVLEFADRLVAEAFAKRGVPDSAWQEADGAIARAYPRAVRNRLPLSHQECRRAAFFILQLFYMKRSGRIPVAAEQFGLALRDGDAGGLPVRRPNKNRVDEVRDALVRVGILTTVSAPRYVDRRAGEYSLNSPYWPPPASGTMLYQPP